ncbi:MAG: iron-regulated protein [Bacteroidetes bacterium]|jgi:uncharacterized iron-regulated protein|nr:iron-regulated protein [Bacteroidota bacterium]
MKFRLLATFIAAFLWIAASESDKPAYLLYEQSGAELDYALLVDSAAAADVVLFGELHNNPIAHWLQLELIQDLQADSTLGITIGMEMFEADQQILIEEYFSGAISTNSFESEARLWNNYQTDYKPILEFARSNGIPLIATNIPRRYASAVYRNGMKALDSLSAEAKQWIAPLPIEVDTTLQSYRNMSQAAHGHGGPNLIYSQAVKDATMAHFILNNLDSGKTFVHLNGSYHSNDDEGIGWYLKKKQPDLSIFTINTIQAEHPDSVDVEVLQSADFTIVVNSDMTKTY